MPDIYILKYDVMDMKGNSANQKTRIVNVVDTKAPQIILNGKDKIEIRIGDEYKELGAKAYDVIDGDVEVRITNNLDTSKLGKYIIQYDSVDRAGNISEKKLREVLVVDIAPLIYVDPIVQIKGKDVLLNAKPSDVNLDMYNSYKAENEPNEFIPDINNGNNGIFK